MPIDKRLQTFFRSPTLGDVFIANALIAIADEMGISDDVLKSVGASGFDPLKTIGGRQVYMARTKSAAQLAKEGMKPADIKALTDYLAEYDLKLPADKNAVPAAIPAAAPVTKVAPKTVNKAAAPSAPSPAPAATGEKTFAGRPVSELAKLTDSQLLKIEGISQATIKQIRAVAAQQASQSSGSGEIESEVITDPTAGK